MISRSTILVELSENPTNVVESSTQDRGKYMSLHIVRLGPQIADMAHGRRLMSAARAERKRARSARATARSRERSALPLRLIGSESGAATSLLEAVLVIAILAVLSTIALVAAMQHVEDARLTRAMADTQIIGIAIQSFMHDTGWPPVFKSGDARGPQDPIFLVLESGGSDAVVDSALDWPKDSTQFDQLENQLIRNQPGGMGTPYPRMGQISYSRFKGWNGPYVTSMPSSDPWGDRYLVNVQLLNPKGVQMDTSLTLGVGQRTAVFVVSAGPNRQLETKFDQVAEAFVAGGDDVVFRIQ
jgi:type II secretory pathway pseudopilin PulG